MSADVRERGAEMTQNGGTLPCVCRVANVGTAAADVRGNAADYAKANAFLPQRHKELGEREKCIIKYAK